MARIYATEQQYRDYLEDPEAEVSVALLRRASRAVEGLVLCTYDVDTAGMPVDPALAEVLMEAVCEQVDYLIESDDETGTGAASAVQSASVGGVSFTRNLTRAGEVQGVGRVAVEVLRSAGLLNPSGVWVNG